MFKIKYSINSITNQNELELLGEFTSEHQELFDNFFEDYELDNIIIHPTKKPTLKPKKERICRFCGKSSPEVYFKSEAHILPQLMGNKNIVSDYECDTCNALFSIYEGDFANFLGMARSLSNLKGQKGLPKFKTPNKKLIIGKNDSNDNLKIIFEEQEDTIVNINTEKNLLTISGEKQPYVPLNIYKMFIKIAYTLLPENELVNIHQLFKEILCTTNRDADTKNHPLFRCFSYMFPGPPLKTPIVFSAIKKEESKTKLIPSRSFSIYFSNYIYQFFLPFYIPDRELIKQGNIINLPVMPPFLDKKHIDQFGNPKFFSIDLSNEEKKYYEQHSITMKFDEAIKLI